jgi:uncharacterized membrane protein YedE/YeeE
MTALYCVLIGIAMGALIQRIGASSPAVILRNLRLENLTIIKFMAATIAFGMIVSYAIDALAPGVMHFDPKPAYVVGVAVGGLIFGVGFALGGYCPGTCVVGLGEGRKDAVAAIAGGLVGALAFTLAYDLLLDPLIKPMDLGKVRLQDYVGLPPVVLALVVGIGMLALMAVLPTNPGQPARDR